MLQTWSMVRKAGRADSLRRRSHIRLRQIECERAAFTRSASQLNFTAKKTGQFTADGKAKSGSTVFAAGTCIRLLEGLKDDSLLVRGDPDARIRNFERNDGSGPTQDLMTRRPATGNHRNGEPHAALFSELERVRQQILEYLL